MEANQLVIEKVSPWGIEKTVELLTAEALKRGWTNPATHDLQQSLAKAGKSIRPVKVVEVCKPEYSGKMLEKNDERIISVMMPCRISVYLKEDDKTYVALINVAALAAGLPETTREVMTAAADEINEIVGVVL